MKNVKRVYTQNIARSPQDAPGGHREAKPGKVYPKGRKDASHGVLVARFEIPYPETKRAMSEWNRRFSLNAYYAGKHYQQRRRDAEFWHLTTKKYMEKFKVIRDPVSFPVVMRFYFNDRLDCSNHAAIVKFVEDGMKGRIIKDDNRRHVKEIDVAFHDEPHILVEVWGA